MPPRARNTSEDHPVVSTANRLSRLLVGLGLAGLTLVDVPATLAQCIGKAGAVGTPSTFCGRPQPTDVTGVPDARDTTEYTGGNQTTDFKHPLFSSVDVEGSYAFTSYAFVAAMFFGS